jgi:serine/threonine protein phosphatase 1
MKKTYVIGDIHGGLKALKQVLERSPIEFGDRLIFLGDYVDGWSESAGVIAYLMELKRSYACVFIRGNHDAWCEEWLKTSEANPVWLFHGGQSTVDSYAQLEQQEKFQHLAFFEQMENYYIDEQQRLFVHAGFSSLHGVEREPYSTNFYWDRTLWEVAQLAHSSNVDESSPIFPKRLQHYSMIFIGHSPVPPKDEKYLPFVSKKLTNADTGAGFFGKLTMMCADTLEFWQSDAVHSLYPTEKGRN